MTMLFEDVNNLFIAPYGFHKVIPSEVLGAKDDIEKAIGSV